MSSPREHDTNFLRYLQQFVDRDDRAALAALRRAAASPEQSIAAHRYVVPWLSREPHSWRDRWADDCHYLVAALFARHPKPWSLAEQYSTDLGASFARLAETGNSASAERRFTALLAASTDELPVRLRNAVSLLKAQDIPVNWAQLLFDLIRWPSQSRSVQRSWARSFWGAHHPEPGEQPLTEDTNAR